MFRRTMSALIGAPIFLGLIYLGGPYTAFLVAVLTLLALREFLKIGVQMGVHAWYIQTTLATAVWLTSLFVGREEWIVTALLFWVVICLGRLALTYPKSPLSEVNYNLLSVIYAVVLLSHLYLLRELPRGLEWTFVTIFLVWATDTGAYLIGRQFGRHLLAPQVSPKKTVEGSVGGLLLSIVVAILCWYLIGGSSWLTYVILAVVIGISAQIGDL
ncbi:MAG: phosphatidate cytidylyltransferase, partial [Desulfosporosinus sp.]|nr:phosphatidate cytidylyltransferase [Desulfosporosinus sp.]